jgi:hypothetical protein
LSRGKKSLSLCPNWDMAYSRGKKGERERERIIETWGERIAIKKWEFISEGGDL